MVLPYFFKKKASKPQSCFKKTLPADGLSEEKLRVEYNEVGWVFSIRSQGSHEGGIG